MHYPFKDCAVLQAVLDSAPLPLWTTEGRGDIHMCSLPQTGMHCTSTTATHSTRVPEECRRHRAHETARKKEMASANCSGSVHAIKWGYPTMVSRTAPPHCVARLRSPTSMAARRTAARCICSRLIKLLAMAMGALSIVSIRKRPTPSTTGPSVKWSK